MEHIKIGQVARRTRISVRTLHHYERIGLLCPSGRDAAGHRLYTRSDLDRLDQIVCLRELDLSLTEIRFCLEDATHLKRVLEGQAEALQLRIREVKRTHHQVKCLLDRLGKAPVTSLLRSVHLFRPEWTDEVMEAMRRRVAEIGEDAFRAARKENRELVVEAGDALRRGIPPEHPDVVELALRLREVRKVLTGDDSHYATQLRRMNDEGFARFGDEGCYTDPSVIAYVEKALNS